MNNSLKVIFIALAAGSFIVANTVASTALEQAENQATTEIPQGLWEAYSKARLLIEPVKDPAIGARFAGQNPAAGLYFLFDEKGVTFKRGSDWSLGMGLESYGTTSSRQAFPTQKLHLDGNTVTLDRGDIQEWYINRAQGLEQGFTLANKPAGHTTGEDIVLTLSLSGELEPRWQREGEKIAFYTEQSDYAFSYDKLLVVDADGRNLPAEMRFTQGQIQLQFDPAGAQWPVTVDPVVSVETKLVGAINDAETDDYFGTSVALSGDTAVIGAPLDDCAGVLLLECGAAYVFAGSGSNWRFEKKLIAEIPIGGERFGYAVALSGDTILIGKQGNFNKAYIFTRSGSIWNWEATLVPFGTVDSNAYFGNSVALDGDTALVGAPKDDCGTKTECGRVFVYTRSGVTWSDSVVIDAGGNTEAGAGFGSSVALAGNKALVGAPYKTCPITAPGCGAAYLFTRTAPNIWSLQIEILSPAPDPKGYFGSSVALSNSGNTALVGAYLENKGFTDSGAAYVYALSKTLGWLYEATLTPTDNAASKQFGSSVAVTDSSAVIGAPFSNSSVPISGAAYVFTNSGSTTWTQQAKLLASFSMTNARFGSSVAMASDSALLIGAETSNGGAVSSGSAYVFSNSGGSWAEEHVFSAVDSVADQKFGGSVALDGDTALIGATGDACSAGINCGAAYVFTRSGSSWAQQQKLYDPQLDASFGNSVALDGDTALIGAHIKDAGTGTAYVFTRTGSTWSLQQQLSASNGQPNDNFGYSVALDGDTALIGAWRVACAAGPAVCGAAYVYTRTGTSWQQQAKLTAESDANTGDFFGNSVALDGDTALIGAGLDTDGVTSPGAAYIFTRIGSIWSREQRLTREVDSSRFGQSVALYGDTALIGAIKSGIGGAAHVYTRAGSLWTHQQALTASDTAAFGEFGTAVALYGDIALISAGRKDCSATVLECGAAYVFVRSGSGWSQQAKLTASDASAGERFGVSVALSGDTALIGAHYASCTAGLRCGAAYLYHFPCGYGSGILANRWTMIGIPCDPGTVNNTVGDIFGDNLNPARYYSRWVLYERDRTNDVYNALSLSSPLKLGEGYWIISLDATVWDVSGTATPIVTNNPNCLTVDGCYEITLTAPAVGLPPRFNLIGHVFSFDVEWADVRVEVNGTAYTPGGAKTAGYMEKEMWIYNGNGYDVFDGSTPGMEGTLMPQDGIWVAVLNGADGKTIKLLIPVSNTFGSPPPPPTLP